MWYLLLIAPLLYSEIRDIQYPVAIEEKQEYAQIADGIEEMYCNCVKFVLTRRPDIPFIDASAMAVATSSPFVGAVAKMYYPHSGLFHVAYVEAVTENEIRVVDANYSHCELTYRYMSRSDARILGYL